MRTNKKIFLVGCCAMLIAGGMLVDFGVPSLHGSAASIAASVKESAKKALEAAKQKALAMKAKLEAFGKAALAAVKAVAKQINNKSYNDPSIQLTVPFTIGDSSAGTAKKYAFGLEYRLFVGGGDIEKGFDPLVAMFWPPIVIDGISFGLTGDQFIAMLKSLTKTFETLTKPIPVIPTKTIVGGLNKSLDALQRITRFAPETVFLLKFYLLARSAGKTVKLQNVPLEINTLLIRLALSVNEPATIAANGGAKSSSAWKTKLYFKDTGIEGIFDKIPPFLRAPIDKMKKPQVTQGSLQEWQDRKNQKAPTAMQFAYSNMRSISDYNSKSLYALEALIPLLDQNLNYADQELFVKALRVHWAHRFDGMMSVLKLKLEADAAQEVQIKEVEIAVESVENVNEELSTVKKIIMDRFPGLIQVLDEGLKKMQSKKFSNAHTSLVANILAKVRSDEQQLIPLTKQIDSIEGEENMSFAEFGLVSDLAAIEQEPTALESIDLSGAPDLPSPI